MIFLRCLNEEKLREHPGVCLRRQENETSPSNQFRVLSLLSKSGKRIEKLGPTHYKSSLWVINDKSLNVTNERQNGAFQNSRMFMQSALGL